MPDPEKLFPLNPRVKIQRRKFQELGHPEICANISHVLKSEQGIGIREFTHGIFAR